MNHDEKGSKFPVDVQLESASPSEYNALLLPGGIANPDKLRTIPRAVQFVRKFAEAGGGLGEGAQAHFLAFPANRYSQRRRTSGM